MSQRVIVTGAAGFIGRNVVAELNRRGFTNLLLVDHLGSDDKWKNLLGLKFEDLISPDSFHRQILSSTVPEARACIHLGACSATTETDADFLLENNYRTTRHICEWSLATRTRFVYASSAATYGDGALGYSDDDETTRKLEPLNMYGYSKHMFDLWALEQGLFDHITGLKYFNVYGPYEDHKENMRSLVQKAYYQVRDKGFLTLFKSHHPDYADGEQMRDFIYVKDAVDVTLHFALESSRGGLFNCGTGIARTWIDLANALFVASGREPDIQFIDMPEELRGKYQYYTRSEVQKLRDAGYDRPFTSLEDGVKNYVQTHLASRL